MKEIEVDLLCEIVISKLPTSKKTAASLLRVFCKELKTIKCLSDSSEPTYIKNKGIRSQLRGSRLLNWASYCSCLLNSLQGLPAKFSPFPNRVKANLFASFFVAAEVNAQRNKESLQATKSSRVTHFSMTHLNRREVVMSSWI